MTGMEDVRGKLLTDGSRWPAQWTGGSSTRESVVVFIELEQAGWVPEPVRMLWRREKSLPVPRFFRYFTRSQLCCWCQGVESYNRGAGTVVEIINNI
jgi:hypothetical protein